MKQNYKNTNLDLSLNKIPIPYSKCLVSQTFIIQIRAGNREFEVKLGSWDLK
jgi:hypothetical protein